KSEWSEPELTRQGLDATTSTDAGHQKQNRRWEMEDSGWKPVRRHKVPSSILHPPSSLLTAAGAGRFSFRLRAAGAARVIERPESLGTRRLSQGGGGIEN